MESRTEASAEPLSRSQDYSGSLMRSHRRRLVIENRRELFDIGWSDLWEYREVLYILVWRDIKVRYKQTAIGVSWVLLQPLIMVLIFTAVFGMWAKMPSDGVWYPVFALSALLPWIYFSQAIVRGGESVVAHGKMVGKIYFPRLLFPLAMSISPLVDFAFSLILLFSLMAYAGIPLSWKVITLPVFILFAMLTAIGISLFTSAMNVRYRDVGHALPFLVQIWMYASPIVYPVSLVPEHWRILYGLNPMVGVIEGFRWALLGQTTPDPVVVGQSVLILLMGLIAGLVFFRKMEREFADFL